MKNLYSSCKVLVLVVCLLSLQMVANAQTLTVNANRYCPGSNVSVTVTSNKAGKTVFTVGVYNGNTTGAILLETLGTITTTDGTTPVTGTFTFTSVSNGTPRYIGSIPGQGQNVDLYSSAFTVGNPDSPIVTTVNNQSSTITYGGSNPTFSVTPPSGQTVNWYSTPTGGTPLATSSTFTPTTTAAGTYRYYAELQLGGTGCVSTTRTPVDLVINQKNITGSFLAKNKTADGKTDCEVLTRSLAGVINNDDAILFGGVANFNDPNVGTGKKVTLTGYSLNGASAGNYTIDSVKVAYADITAATPLPVELTSFSAKRAGDVVNLAWATASEKDNDYFEVQQSEDGKAFKAVGERVAGHGTTSIVQNYKAAITAAATQTLYFRLKQVDYDGKFEYSKVIAVKAVDAKTGVKAALEVYPNPTTSKVTVNTTETSGTAEVTLFHSSGRAVLQQEVQLTAGKGIELDLAGQHAGIYYLQVQTATSKATTRIVKK
jgi:hypothetical protein